MIIKIIETGEIVDVDDIWGERLIEQGKAEPAGLESEPAKAEATVADETPDSAEEPAQDDAKADTAKKAGKKR